MKTLNFEVGWRYRPEGTTTPSSSGVVRISGGHRGSASGSSSTDSWPLVRIATTILPHLPLHSLTLQPLLVLALQLGLMVHLLLLRGEGGLAHTVAAGSNGGSTSGRTRSSHLVLGLGLGGTARSNNVGCRRHVVEGGSVRWSISVGGTVLAKKPTLL